MKRIEEKVSENQKILKKLLLHNRWISLVNAIKWIVILGAAFGLYYYFQPVIDQTIDLYKNVMTGAETLFQSN